MPRVPNSSPQTRALLESLLDSPSSWRYGYDLSRETGLASGTLYPILMRLHEQEWLEAEWELPQEPGRLPRHLYRLTALGRRRAIEAVRKGSKTSKILQVPRWETS